MSKPKSDPKDGKKWGSRPWLGDGEVLAIYELLEENSYKRALVRDMLWNLQIKFRMDLIITFNNMPQINTQLTTIG